MHQLFTIDEILRNIFSNIRENTDILQTALVCRDFLEPGLDELWCFMYSFSPFLDLLPADSGVFSVTRPLDPNDWGRFDFYASRCKHFQWIDHPGLNFAAFPVLQGISQRHQSRFAALGTVKSCPPLLPKLVTLSTSVDTSTFSFVCQVLISSTLKDCQLRCTGEFASFTLASELVHALENRRPRLTTFRMPSLQWNESLSNSFASFISATPSLVEVDISSELFAHKPVIRAIAQLPSLLNLSLGVGIEDCIGEGLQVALEDVAASGGGFRSLKRLEGGDIYIETVLNAGLALTILDVKVTSFVKMKPSIQKAIPLLCRTIARQCPRLQRFMVKGDVVFIGWEDPDIYVDQGEFDEFDEELETFIGLLQQSTGIVDFQVVLPEQWRMYKELNLTNKAYDFGIQRWSNLQRFSVHGAPTITTDNTPPAATLDILTSFASYCPKLVYLGIEVDATVAYDRSALDASSGFRSPLTYRVGRSWITGSNVEAVTYFFDKMFRNAPLELDISGTIVEDSDHDEEGTKMWSCWAKIERNLQVDK